MFPYHPELPHQLRSTAHLLHCFASLHPDRARVRLGLTAERKRRQSTSFSKRFLPFADTSRQLRTNLFALIIHLHSLLIPILSRTPAHILHLPSRASQDAPSPILGLLTPTPHALSTFLLDKGFVTRPVVPPTVPPGGERVRICLRTGMERKTLDGLVEALEDWVETRLKQEGILRGSGTGLGKEMILKAKL